MSIFNNIYRRIVEAFGEDRYADPNTPFWGMEPKNIQRLSDIAKSLYRNIQRSGDGTPFIMTKEIYNKYKIIDSQDLYDVIDTALEFDFQVNDEIWDLLKRKDPKLYHELRSSIGKDIKKKRLPNDQDLYYILRRHPEFGSTRGVRYKPNAGMWKYRDIIKRIRVKYGDQAEGKIVELDEYIASKRRYSNA